MTAGGSYPVRNSPVGPGGEESFDYQQVMQMMHGLDPGQVASAAEVLTGLADQLDSLRSALKSAAAQASQNWSGTAAQSAMNQFQVLHDQTAQLAAQSRTAGNTLHWLGNDVMPKYQSLPSPQVAGGWKGLVADAAQGVVSGKGGIEEAMAGGPGKAKANSATQDYLKTFNQHLATANNAMPKTLASPNPTIGSNTWTAPSANPSGIGASTGSGAVSGYAGGSGSNAPGAAGTSGHAAPPTSNPFTASKLPHSGTTSNASLQGYTPPAGTGTSPYGSGALGPRVTSGGGANPFARMPVVPGGASRYGSGAAEGESGLGSEAAKLGENDMPGETGTLPGENGGAAASDGPPGAADAAGAEAAGSEAAGAAGAGEGAAGMPMGAGGGGGQDRERQRQAWMSEDKSIWGLPDEDIGSVLE